MFFIRSLLVLCLLFPIFPKVGHATVIHENHGGDIAWFQGWVRRLPGPIVVDGVCNSACTMLLGRRDLCVTPRASFGFHQAFFPSNGARSPRGTAIVASYWPAGVKAWINQQGGLPFGRPLVLRGEALRALVKPCA